MTEQELREVIQYHSMMFGHHEWLYINNNFNILQCAKCDKRIDLRTIKEITSCSTGDNNV